MRGGRPGSHPRLRGAPAGWCPRPAGVSPRRRAAEAAHRGGRARSRLPPSTPGAGSPAGCPVGRRAHPAAAPRGARSSPRARARSSRGAALPARGALGPRPSAVPLLPPPPPGGCRLHSAPRRLLLGAPPRPDTCEGACEQQRGLGGRLGHGNDWLPDSIVWCLDPATPELRPALGLSHYGGEQLSLAAKPHCQERTEDRQEGGKAGST
ncbi:uncharacterized protein [Vulpes vulpes]|uniref:Uncharacterized protein n=1 Tax=Vulpes vulpes TaxID=9627 RepID=A0ABM4ZU86_VULVU